MTPPIGPGGPRPEERELLKRVAAHGGLHAYVATSSGELAEELGVSQQTASRWILSLKDENLIERRLGARGQQLRLTGTGVDVLAAELKELEAIFSESSEIDLAGTVTAGDGEGAYYMRQPFYKQGFKRLLGFEPYPGTLNLQLEGADLDTMRALRNREGLEIPKFETDERTFGGVTSFPADINGLEGGAIFPHRTRHDDILEVIAPTCLRKELGLLDGDVLHVVLDARPERKTYNPREASL